jgi:hypothetical protein
MEALIAREKALAGAASSAAPPSKKKRPAGGGAGPSSSAAKQPAAAKKPKGTPQEAVFNADLDDDDDDDDDDEDEELAENGYIVPDTLADPATTEEAEELVGRRVYLDGVPGKDALAGELIGWRRNKGQWEVELDRHDERILVRSANLRFLDVRPPPRKSAAAKPKTPKPDGAAASGGAAAGGGGKKQTPKQRRGPRR